MQSLSRIDLPTRLEPVMPRWAGETVAALICVAGVGVVRFTIDAAAPGVSPFVLLFPTTLIATLIGGWRAGAATLCFCEFWAWCYEIPPRGLAFKGEAQPANLAAILVAGLVVVALVQAFRASARREADEGGARLAERDLMVRELEHRMRNNFQTVTSLIELQLRRVTDPASRQALSEALGRVMSISEAHRNLYAPTRIDGQGGAAAPIDMAVYLKELCANLASALLLGERVRLECRVEPGALERERAVAVGLIVNELVTNAAKHAFADGRGGQIRVAFGRRPQGYRLLVEDDGKGLPPDFATRPQGLGRSLVAAFTRQARGSMKVKEGPGARFELDLAA